MVSRLVPLVLVVLLASPLAAWPGPVDPQRNQPQPSEHLTSGARHFDRAFYDLTPKKRDVEAAREFDLAVAAFRAELRANPASAEAHRYLGRIFTARKQYRQAARHYDHLGELVPGDVDALVLSATAWAEAGDLAQARARLTRAKGRTSDPGALARLDEYLARLDQRRPARLP